MKAKRVRELRTTYSSRLSRVLRPLAEGLERHLRDLAAGYPRIDSLRVRPKAVESFLQKAALLRNGKRKYAAPLNEIQDQIGARIVVRYLEDVDRVCEEVVRPYFQPIEDREIVPDSPSEFGYVGRHFVLFVPSDLLDETWLKGDYPVFFELQVKTLFQHAWAEANHDLAYKTAADITPDQRRSIAFTAAQAWGADRIFQELATEIGFFDSNGDPPLE